MSVCKYMVSILEDSKNYNLNDFFVKRQSRDEHVWWVRVLVSGIDDHSTTVKVRENHIGIIYII